MVDSPLFGLRVVISFLATAQCYFLFSVIPIYAYVVGDIKFPNLMVSEIVAAGPTYRSMYTLGFCYNVYSVSHVWTEWMRLMKSKAPALSPQVDAFLLLMHFFFCPSLLLLSVFQFGTPKEADAVHDDWFSWFVLSPQVDAFLLLMHFF